MNMKTNYSAIRATLQALDVVRAEYNRYSSLNNGVISGGIDLSEQSAGILRLCAEGLQQVEEAISGGCRISHLKSVVADYGSTRDIQTVIRDAEMEAEYRRDGWDR